MLNPKARPSTTGSWSSERTRDREARSGLTITGVISVAFHLLLLALVIWQPVFRVPLQPAEIPAELELALGDGAAKTGAPPPSSSQPPQPAQKPAPQVQPTPKVEAAKETPKDDGDLHLPTPSETPPKPEVKPTPQAAQPVQQAVARPPTEVNLGDGIAAPPAEYRNPLAQVDSVPDPNNVAPVYPREAAMRGEQGNVLVAIYVDAKGNVAGVELLQSSGSTSLDSETLDTIKRWHFRPAFHEGLAVPSVRQQMVSYSAR